MSKISPVLIDEIRARLCVSEVVSRRVSLKKIGREWKGLSPFNKEKTPSFFVNDQKGMWFDFSSGKNGSIFDFVMATDGLSFPEAVELLAGQAGVPLPKSTYIGRRDPEVLKAERDAEALRQKEHLRWQEERERDNLLTEAQMLEYAIRIFGETVDIDGREPDRYLSLRGLIKPAGGWPDVLRCHPNLKHPDGRYYPCLVARVDDVCGDICGIWRIYLDPRTGNKIKSDAKLGLGSTSGGAVRIGGCAEKISVGEGIESSLGAWLLIERSRPVWSTLSTSGMKNFEVPPETTSVSIFPDGDRFKFRPDGELADDPTPAGIKAARALRDRLKPAGVRCWIEPEPCEGADYLDVWNRLHAREVA